MRTTIERVTKVALLFCASAVSQAWAVATLQEIKVNPLLADQLLVELSFSEPVTGFTDRLSYQPNQLLLHVPGAVGALKVNPLPIQRQGVDNIKVEGKGAGLDFKIALDQLAPYQVQQQGNKLLVSLGEGASSGLINGESALIAPATSATPVSAPSAMVATTSPSALLNPQVVARSMPVVPVTAPVAAQTASKPVLNNYQSSGGGAYFNSVTGVDFRRGKDGQGEFLSRWITARPPSM